MKIVVVYESMFGNTKAVGEGIAEGLRGAGEVKAGTIDDLPPEEVRDAALIVVGGPTQARGMARGNARESLMKKGSHSKYGQLLPGRGNLRGWLDRLPAGRGRAAAFDTRFDRPLSGSAAKEIAAGLRRKGYPIAGTRSFFVQATGGPLADGERERAIEWGRELAANVKETPAG